jgi:uncharacterized protein (DUF433 family)
MHHPQIISNPNVMMGKPAIAGTRITVEHILEQLAGGRTIDEILAAHPHITFKDVQTALLYATESVRFDHTIHPSQS